MMEPAPSLDSGAGDRVVEAVPQAMGGPTALEAENADLARRLADAENEIAPLKSYVGVRETAETARRDVIGRVLQRGWASREDILDSVVTAAQARGMGWLEDPSTGCWHAPVLMLDLPTRSYVPAPSGAGESSRRHAGPCDPPGFWRRLNGESAGCRKCAALTDQTKPKTPPLPANALRHSPASR